MDKERLQRAGNLDIDPDKIMFLTQDEYNSMYSVDQEFKRVVEKLEELELKVKEAAETVQLDLKRVDEIADSHMRAEFIKEELNYDKTILRKLQNEYNAYKIKFKDILSKNNEEPRKGR